MSRRAWAGVADLAVVVVFVVFGRSSHAEALSPGGLFRTGVPFLLALAATHLVPIVGRRPWSLPAGLVVWLGTVAGAMVLRRVVFGDGTATSFVIVTAAFLGALFLGWRAAVAAFARVSS